MLNRRGVGKPLTAPDAEVVAKATRRRFTAEYKLRVLDEADACTTSGAIGTLLRREGLYSSHLTSWRQQRERSARAGLAVTRRGRPAAPGAVAERATGSLRPARPPGRAWAAAGEIA